ncbi:uncharacterized protein [Nicotiana sylvestris]|uniref:uncharacterized protein n=1 Tax=Nicotiana sylvestris TaxID=4096 RepID=UPI00388CBD23
MKDSKVVLKGMRHAELEKWVQSHGYKPAQALMLWKRLYGNNINIWAQCNEELEGLNKDFRKMLSEHAEFKTLNLKDILTASDGTKKVSHLLFSPASAGGAEGVFPIKGQLKRDLLFNSESSLGRFMVSLVTG